MLIRTLQGPYKDLIKPLQRLSTGQIIRIMPKLKLQAARFSSPDKLHTSSCAIAGMILEKFLGASVGVFGSF